jgi:DNA polymerase elongation subunit (family B)
VPLSAEADWTNFGKGCKYEMNYVYVEKDLYYIHKNKFTGLAAQAATDLLTLCGEYKTLMKLSDRKGDRAMVQVYNALQMAAKEAANAIYGIMLLLSKEVGGTITFEARNQNERAMRYLFEKTGGGASMADTDSMSPIVADIRLDALDGALSVVRDAIAGKNAGHVEVSHLIQGVMDRYAILLDNLNNGIPGEMEPAWPKPAKLELEKVCFPKCFLQRKCTLP